MNTHQKAEDFLRQKLEERKAQQAYRQLRITDPRKADFCSNDYLGIVKRNLLSHSGINSDLPYGSTGSRLLSGNYGLIEETEYKIASFHDSPAALIFNSGYDANLALLSSVPQRTDTVIYDYLSHASLRDGIRLSGARSFSFRHNDLEHLEKKLREATGKIFIVTESVFSMDGDIAPISEIINLSERYGASVILDEAHATGVVGSAGEGLAQREGLHRRCFARIHTFGKACGTHGAVVLGSHTLKEYLVNFSRAFIYTTSLPPVAVESISKAYDVFPRLHEERLLLGQRIFAFREAVIKFTRCNSITPIQAVIIPGNSEVKMVAAKLQDCGLDVRPILYPTVPKGEERLRIVLHAFNTTAEVEKLIACLS